MTIDIVTNRTDLGPYDYELLLSSNLLCRHHLHFAYEMGIPIPRTLFHPRWWINGAVIRGNDWQPRYREVTEVHLMLLPKRKDIYKAIAGVL